MRAPARAGRRDGHTRCSAAKGPFGKRTSRLFSKESLGRLEMPDAYWFHSERNTTKFFAVMSEVPMGSKHKGCMCFN